LCKEPTFGIPCLPLVSDDFIYLILGHLNLDVCHGSKFETSVKTEGGGEQKAIAGFRDRRTGKARGFAECRTGRAEVKPPLGRVMSLDEERDIAHRCETSGGVRAPPKL
jgi:hypothetical protein